MIVRASGYEDLELELEPSPDRRFDAELRPKKPIVAVKPGKPKSGDPKLPKPGEKKGPEPTPTVDPKPTEPKPVGSMGLKNPFETRPNGG